MKIVVTALGDTRDDAVAYHFAASPKLYLWEMDEGREKALDNPYNPDADSEPAAQTALRVTDQGADIVITGSCSPRAVRDLLAAGVRVYTGAGGTVAEALAAFEEGRLPEAEM